MQPAPKYLENRARTAIGRAEPSRPLKCILADGLLTPGIRLFDYGCGRGDDLRHLSMLGFEASGWDPVHRPDHEHRSAPVVTIGYVVNVIENPAERQEALRRAWALAEQVLVVSARLTLEAKALRERTDYEDGCLTSRGTFQKFFEQQELRQWIDRTLEANAVPAAPGVFYVFRDEQARTHFLASRYRRRLAAPRLTKSAELFARHEAVLAPLMEFVGERGRLPQDDELANTAELAQVFGSIRKAFRVVLYATDEADWEAVREERGRDLSIYLALSRFEGRPPFGKLPLALQRDVKAFFGNYKQACTEADTLLYSLGQPGTVEEACQNSAVGKLTPTALYIHESALPILSPVLRLYEGCARGYLGRVDGANIIKMHRGEPKISYLNYPDFDNDPHPPLAESLTVHLQTFRVKTRSFGASSNRPILHRKELFISADHPLHAKFSRLTRIEESKGLFDDTSRIGLEEGWNETLAQKGVYLKGHRLLSARG
ncbi:DNA phosphorothioation-associated putative methyltransferase [Eilatimonas milleporae]|uniref:DNA phosphorothioation-associated putative methyltransferase n=1 Tax=Eilatimonas milleporae TaxID=911205 RepID=A0A3M0C4E5_9PROT|nr:DNA phosphorothioation-associated putative methyltransferase [Eilatimonas milleporae]RMB01959.1 DNA phosphorothioation-associated putative methyltransferase [Eilatimonas milleporae]